jgi:site-specific recombinase XerD
VNALEALAAEHLKALAAHGYAVHTRKNRRAHLRQFTTWCELRGITTAPEITREALELYRHWLYERRTKDGKPLAWGTQAQKLVAVRQWLAWLAKTERLLMSPASALELPKLPRRLPRAVLSVSEAEAVLARPDPETTLGLRDRAILEVLYSTGIRRAELAGLLLPDADFERGILLVREGKGGKDRFVPVGERALVWVEVYLNRARPRLARGRDPGHLFLTSRGGRFHTNRFRAGARLHRRRGSGQEWQLPHLPPHRGDADAGGRRRHPRHPGAARPRRPQQHAGLHPRLDPAPERGARPHASGRRPAPARPHDLSGAACGRRCHWMPPPAPRPAREVSARPPQVRPAAPGAPASAKKKVAPAGASSA